MNNQRLRIKEILKEKNVTINELADHLGIHRVTLSNMISGNPTLISLTKIAKYLSVEIADLFYIKKEDNFKIVKGDDGSSFFIYCDNNIKIRASFSVSNELTFELHLLNHNCRVSPSISALQEFIVRIENKGMEETILYSIEKKEYRIMLFNLRLKIKEHEYSSLKKAIQPYIYYYNLFESKTEEEKQFSLPLSEELAKIYNLINVLSNNTQAKRKIRKEINISVAGLNKIIKSFQTLRDYSKIKI